MTLPLDLGTFTHNTAAVPINDDVSAGSYGMDGTVKGKGGE
jgi:hypothetical protein